MFGSLVSRSQETRRRWSFTTESKNFPTAISTYRSIKNDPTYLSPVSHDIFPEEVETIKGRVQLDILV